MTIDQADPGRATPEPPPPSLNTSWRAVARNVMSSYFTLIVGALLGLIVTPILLDQLGTERFGVWSLAIGLAAYVTLAEAGVGVATVARVAASESEGSKALSKVLSTSLALSSIIAAIGLALSVGLSIAFPHLFHVPASLTTQSQVAMLILGGWVSLQFIGNVFSACLTGTGRLYLVTLKGFAIASTISILQLLAALAGAGLPALAALTFAGGVASLLVYRRQVHRSYPDVRVTTKLADRRLARRLLSLGLRNSVAGTAGTLAFGSDILLVGLLLNPTAAAAYAIALKVQSLLKNVAGGVAGPLGPSHAHAAANFGAPRRFRLFSMSVHLSLVLTICGTATVAAYATPLLDMWLRDVPPHTATVLIVLCAVLLFQIPGLTAYIMLISSEQVGELVRPIVVAALCNIVLSVIFTETVGVQGPALGSLATVVIFDAVYLPWRVCQLLDVPFGSFLSEVLRPLALPTLILACLLAVGRALVTSGPLVIVAGAAACAAFLVTWWLGSGSQDVRRMLAERSLPAAA